MPRRGAAADRLSGILDHRFTDPALLAEALTHPSAAATASGRRNYERMEFLGDRVLSLVIARMLLDAFPDEPEGDLAQRHAGLVRREALVTVADAIGLAQHVTLSPGEAESARDQDSLKADSMEAVIGALFLDGGLDTAARFIEQRWAPLMDASAHPPRDAKTALQEWAQGRGLNLPRYEEVARSGPDHAPLFTVRATVDGLAAAEATGRSKRAAEQAAARRLLDQATG